ncbi:META domain-containing protein [Mongoliibacter ruber]|nr:META domain-containing protein [Mongoliibacter ruber]
MKTLRRIFLLSLAIILMNACNTDEFEGCPLSYTVKTGDFDLTNSWAFVGFRTKGAGGIDFPPCDTYAGAAVTLGKVNLTFTQNPSSQENGFFEFAGASVVNSFTGSYRTFGNGRIEALNRLAITLIAGNEVLSNYENRYLQGLRNMESYRIQNNMLMIAFNGDLEEMIFVLIES